MSTLELLLPDPAPSAAALLRSGRCEAEHIIIDVVAAPPGSASNIALLLQCLELALHSDSVRHMHLGGSALTPVMAQIVCETVTGKSTLLSFSIASCSAKVGAAFPGIAQCIRHHASMHTLDLSGLTLGTAGMREIAPAAATMPCLQTLRLHNCGLNDGSAAILAAALAGHEQLIDLNLMGNDISPAGSHALLCILCSCPRIKSIFLPVGSWDFADLAWISGLRSRPS